MSRSIIFFMFFLIVNAMSMEADAPPMTAQEILSQIRALEAVIATYKGGLDYERKREYCREYRREIQRLQKKRNRLAMDYFGAKYNPVIELDDPSYDPDERIRQLSVLRRDIFLAFIQRTAEEQEPILHELAQLGAEVKALRKYFHMDPEAPSITDRKIERIINNLTEMAPGEWQKKADVVRNLMAKMHAR